MFSWKIKICFKGFDLDFEVKMVNYSYDYDDIFAGNHYMLELRDYNFVFFYLKMNMSIVNSDKFIHYQY
jgi:hypothetical protein